MMEVVDANLQEVERQQSATFRLLEQYRKGNLIPFKSLADVAEGEKLLLAPGVRCYRLPTLSSRNLQFIFEFDAQSILKNHFHDCSEHLQMLRGDLYDFENGNTITSQASYEAMKAHELYSAGGCLGIVRFSK